MAAVVINLRLFLLLLLSGTWCGYLEIDVRHSGSLLCTLTAWHTWLAQLSEK